jgi:hypothetical protein
MILTLELERKMAELATHHKLVAETGVNTGRLRNPYDQLYLDCCKGTDFITGTVLIFSRDIGHHTSGWFKNPDYENCYHLSLSFFDPVTEDRIDQDKRLARVWCSLFFGKDTNLLWCEPPYSKPGKQFQVWHYRLFCDPGWQAIKPRKEVYSRDFTAKNWLSYSDLQARLEKTENEP